jgi:hypothetical protein
MDRQRIRGEVQVVYRFDVHRRDYADLASGAVLHSAPGFPAFPVRLAAEMFLRGLALVGGRAPVTIWDPCCGTGYLVTVLALLHRRRVDQVIASDIDARAVTLARRNLRLLTGDGLGERAAELTGRADRFGKPSYAATAEAATRLARQLAGHGGDVPAVAGVADAFDSGQLVPVLGGRTPQLVITDVPYGEQTHWHGPAAGGGLPAMVRAVAAVVPPETVMVVAARGRRVPLGAVAPPIERFKVGTRSVAIVRAGQLRTVRWADDRAEAQR